MDFFESSNSPQHDAPQASNLSPAIPPLIFFLLPRLCSAIRNATNFLPPRLLAASETHYAVPALCILDKTRMLAEQESISAAEEREAATEHAWRAEFAVVGKLCGPPLLASTTTDNVPDAPVPAVSHNEGGEESGRNDEIDHRETAGTDQISREDVSAGEEDEEEEEEEDHEEADDRNDNVEVEDMREHHHVSDPDEEETAAADAHYQAESLLTFLNFLSQPSAEGGAHTVAMEHVEHDHNNQQDNNVSLPDYDEEYFSNDYVPHSIPELDGAEGVTPRRLNFLAELCRREYLRRVGQPPADEPRCPICLEEIYIVPVITTACRHTFCAMCITRWLEEEGTCPFCREPVIWLGLGLGYGRLYSDSGDDEPPPLGDSEGSDELDSASSRDSSSDSGDSALYSRIAHHSGSPMSTLDDVDLGE